MHELMKRLVCKDGMNTQFFSLQIISSLMGNDGDLCAVASGMTYMLVATQRTKGQPKRNSESVTGFEPTTSGTQVSGCSTNSWGTDVSRRVYGINKVVNEIARQHLSLFLKTEVIGNFRAK